MSLPFSDYPAELRLVLLGVLEEDCRHSDGEGTVDVFLFIVGKDAFGRIKVEAVEQGTIDLRKRLDLVFLGGDDLAVEQAEDFVLGHSHAHSVAPVGQAVEFVAFGFEAGEELSHSGHFAVDDRWEFVRKDLDFPGEFGVEGLHLPDRFFERLVLLVQRLEPMVGQDAADEFVLLLQVGDEGLDEAVEIIVYQDLAEVEYEGFDHGAKIRSANGKGKYIIDNIQGYCYF